MSRAPPSAHGTPSCEQQSSVAPTLPHASSCVSPRFRALQLGYLLSAPDNNAVPLEDELQSLSGIGEASWPLFLRAHNWLRLLDGTLAQPFFSTTERSAAASKTSGWHSEEGVLEALPGLDDEQEDEDEMEEEAVVEQTGAFDESGGRRPKQRRGGGGGVLRLEMTFE